jgi:hypothetical protein
MHREFRGTFIRDITVPASEIAFIRNLQFEVPEGRNGRLCQGGMFSRSLGLRQNPLPETIMNKFGVRRFTPFVGGTILKKLKGVTVQFIEIV